MEQDILFKDNCLRLLPKFRDMQNFMTEEVWEDVKGYEGIYKISNRGILASLPRMTCNNRRIAGGVMVPRAKEGYGSVPLSRDGKTREQSIHRMVAMAFIMCPDGKDQVNHKDCNKMNNNWWNLEWVTHRENFEHAVANNLIPTPVMRKHRRRSKRRQEVMRLREERTQTIKSFLVPYIRALANSLNVEEPTILAAVRKLSMKDIEQKEPPTSLTGHDQEWIGLTTLKGEFPQKYAGNPDRGHSRGTMKTAKIFEAKDHYSPIGEEAKKPDLQKNQAQQFFSWEKSEKREESPITLTNTTLSIRVRDPTGQSLGGEKFETSEGDFSMNIPDDMACTVLGCNNRRSNAGYGRYRKVCERHHRERFGMDYQRTSRKGRRIERVFH